MPKYEITKRQLTGFSGVPMPQPTLTAECDFYVRDGGWATFKKRSSDDGASKTTTVLDVALTEVESIRLLDTE